VTTIKLKNGLKVLAYEDGKPKRYSRADAEKELKNVRAKGHNAQIRKAKPSGDHFIAILDDEEGGEG
jgi:murein tripeptide amidase MpaA